jgi:hypothetical protein
MKTSLIVISSMVRSLATSFSISIKASMSSEWVRAIEYRPDHGVCLGWAEVRLVVRR